MKRLMILMVFMVGCSDVTVRVYSPGPVRHHQTHECYVNGMRLTQEPCDQLVNILNVK